MDVTTGLCIRRQGRASCRSCSGRRVRVLGRLTRGSRCDNVGGGGSACACAGPAGPGGSSVEGAGGGWHAGSEGGVGEGGGRGGGGAQARRLAGALSPVAVSPAAPRETMAVLDAWGPSLMPRSARARGGGVGRGAPGAGATGGGAAK